MEPKTRPRSQRRLRRHRIEPVHRRRHCFNAWARSASPGAVSVHTGAVVWHFALSSAPRDDLDTFVGASPRRGAGARKEIIYVAGEEWVPLRAEHFSRGDECNVLAHASNTTAVKDA